MSHATIATHSAPLDDEAARIRAALDAVCEGASVRKACADAGVTRKVFHRRVEDDADLRARYQHALVCRAHSLAAFVEDLAEGRDTADETAAAIVDAVKDAAPQHVEKIARAVMREKVQRDRLRFDAARWLASRLLPATYGAQSTATVAGSVQHTVNVVFDRLPTPGAVDAPSPAPALPPVASPLDPEDADYETLDE